MAIQWETLKEGIILKTPNVRVRFIKDIDEYAFTGEVMEIYIKCYNGYVGELASFCKDSVIGWQIESKVIGGDIQFGEGIDVIETETASPNYESLHKYNLDKIKSLQEESARLKEIIKLLSKQI